MIKQAVATSGVLNQLNNQFLAVELIPETLLPTVIAHTGGDLTTRCEAVASFRHSLLQGGELASPVPWLPEAVQNKLLNVITQSSIRVKFPCCKRSLNSSDFCH